MTRLEEQLTIHTYPWVTTEAQKLLDLVDSQAKQIKDLEQKLRDWQIKWDIDKLKRCGVCESPNVRRWGMGYIKCDDCGKLGN